MPRRQWATTDPIRRPPLLDERPDADDVLAGTGEHATHRQEQRGPNGVCSCGATVPGTITRPGSWRHVVTHHGRIKHIGLREDEALAVQARYPGSTYEHRPPPPIH